jgi:polysaccharide export outer membrane protein
MKNIYSPFTFCLVLLSLLSLSSCRSYKELILFRNAQADSLIQVLPPSATEYRIRPGDILYVSIKTLNEDVNKLFNPEARMEQQASYQQTQQYASPEGAYLNGYDVDSLGMLNLPFMGKMYVAGHTQVEIESIVQKKADEFLKDAIVKVKLLNYKVTLLGEVRSPGVYYYYGDNLTLTEALAMAGGHTDLSNINEVMIVRPSDRGNKSYRIDLSSTKAYAEEAFYLKPNDYVFVSPDKFKSIYLTAPAYSFFFSIVSFSLSILALIGVF